MEEKVIFAAIEEMHVHSLRFTMDDLTKRLHMSKTSLYKIVGTKDNLVHEIINYLMESFEAEEKKIVSEKISAREKVSRFVDEYTRAFKLLGNGTYNDLQLNYHSEWLRCEKFRRQKIDVLLDLINSGMESGEFRQVNSAVLQHCLILMSSILMDTEFLNENNLTYPQAIDIMRDLVFHGLLKH